MYDFKIDTTPTPRERIEQIGLRQKYQSKHQSKRGYSSQYVGRVNQEPLSCLMVFSYMFKAVAAFFLLMAATSLFVFEIEEALLSFCILVSGALGTIFLGLIAEAASKIKS
jgi:hypothetical protein